MPDDKPRKPHGCIFALLGALAGAILAPVAMVLMVFALSLFQAALCHACDMAGTMAFFYGFAFIAPAPGALLGAVAGLVCNARRRAVRRALRAPG